MREIKFRLFIGGKFEYWGFLGNSFVGLPDTNIDPMTIEEKEERSQQYTGRKDKNCKEIYEGDVVSGIGANEMIKKQVDMHTFCGWPYINANRFEIIGNIYENPELLEGVKT